MNNLNGSSNSLGCRRGWPGRALVSVFLLAGTVGCHDYRWQWHFEKPEDLEKVEKTAANQGKCLFVFYKDFLDGQSGRMHREVLGDNAVGVLFQDTVNVLLDRSGGRLVTDYMSKYSVAEVPAFVIVAPDGKYERKTGMMSKAQFIEWVQKAKAIAGSPGRK